MLIFKHQFLLMPSFMMQLCWLLVCLKRKICLIKQLCSYVHTLHLLVSIFNKLLCWHHFWEDCAVCNHTDQCPTTQEFTDKPKLPTIHLCALEPLPERTPYPRDNSHGLQWHDCQGQGTQKTLLIPLPVQDCLRAQKTGHLPKIPNRHCRRQCPGTGCLHRRSIRQPCAYPSFNHQPRITWVPWFGPLLLPDR